MVASYYFEPQILWKIILGKSYINIARKNIIVSPYQQLLGMRAQHNSPVGKKTCILDWERDMSPIVHLSHLSNFQDGC